MSGIRSNNYQIRIGSIGLVRSTKLDCRMQAYFRRHIRLLISSRADMTQAVAAEHPVIRLQPLILRDASQRTTRKRHLMSQFLLYNGGGTTSAGLWRTKTCSIGTPMQMLVSPSNLQQDRLLCNIATSLVWVARKSDCHQVTYKPVKYTISVTFRTTKGL